MSDGMTDAHKMMERIEAEEKVLEDWRKAHPKRMKLLRHLDIIRQQQIVLRQNILTGDVEDVTLSFMAFIQMMTETYDLFMNEGIESEK